ncbi:cupredoxin domain-containing protein [Fodinicola acaciae]|uniref:cupredoxin domain-containing protein n=1 Tax=Fodinicola acaciae TaxID=2681555 RepID=UPI0013D80ADE|nr:plastocyanin/azurin family copper-binding protein [Fodinicola acaciae]
MRKLLILAAVCWLAFPVTPAAAATHSVSMRQYAYAPAALTITAGDTIRWTNYDTAQHDVTITNGPVSFHGPLIGKGQSWTYTFGTAGTYSYVCSIHPDMKARIVVRPKAVVSSATPAPAPARPRPSASASPAVVAPSASMPMVATPAPDSASLSPLLIVAGISVAVVVFCLLLMSSRPTPSFTSHRELDDTAVLPKDER